MINPYLYYELKDKNNVVLFHKKQKSHSFVRNYHHLIFIAASMTLGVSNDTTQPRNTSNTLNNLSIYNSSGSQPNTFWFYSPYGVGAPTNISTSLIVGTGTAAEDFEGYALSAIIGDGTGSGQLSHGALATSTTNANPIFTMVWNRLFTNSSGGDITIGECGFYSNFTNGGGEFMFNRDKLSSTITVANSQTFYLQYDLVITLS